MQGRSRASMNNSPKEYRPQKAALNPRAPCIEGAFEVDQKWPGYSAKPPLKILVDRACEVARICIFHMLDGTGTLSMLCAGVYELLLHSMHLSCSERYVPPSPADLMRYGMVAQALAKSAFDLDIRLLA